MFGSARAAVLGYVLACSSGGAPDQEVSLASASAGGFSSSNNWKTDDVGPDMSTSRTFVILFRRTGTANNQTLWGFSDATHGWFLIHGNSNNLLLFFRGGGGTSWTISGNLFLGYHCLAISRMADGSVRYSLDGSTDAQLVASPTYTACIAGSDHFLGHNTIENFPGTNTEVLATAVIDAECTGAERETFAKSVNLLNRYHLRTEVTAHASLRHYHHFQDWDGSSSSISGSLGSSPYTWTKAGTGGGKNTIAEEIRYRIKQNWMHDNGYWIELATGIRRHSLFARTRFTTDATKLVVDTYATNSGFTNQIDIGVKSNAVNQTGNHTGGLDLDVFDQLRTLDMSLPAGTAKSVELIDGIQSYNIGPGTVLGVFPQYIRVPSTTPITPVFYTSPLRRLVIVGDSLTCQLTDSSANISSSTYQAWTILARNFLAGTTDPAWTGTQVSLESWGSKSWSEIASDSTKRATFVSQVGPMLDGTASTYANRIAFALGTNDYGLGLYTSVATLETDVGLLMDSLHSAYPNLEITIITPTMRKNETVTIGAPAWNLPGLRTALVNVAATRSWIRLVVGQGFVGLLNRNVDTANELHFERDGHIEYEGWFGRAMGYRPSFGRRRDEPPPMMGMPTPMAMGF